MLSPAYEIATNIVSYGRVSKSFTYEIGALLLCQTGEMLSPTYDIATDLMSYKQVNKSYV